MNIKKAGAIITNKDHPDQVLLLYRKKQGDWSFPKGKIEAGESAFDAMRREIFEETGLMVKDIQELPELHYEDNNRHSVVLIMFIARSIDGGIPRTEFEGDMLVWENLQNVAQRLTYKNLRSYFFDVLPQIKKWIDQQSLK